jgi:6-phosphofructokinase
VFDRNLGTNYGAKAVEHIMQGESGVVGFRGGKYIFVPIEEAFKQTRKFDMDEYILAQRLSF